MPTWKAILGQEGESLELEREMAMELSRRLELLVSSSRVTTLSSHKVFEGLEVAELSGLLGALDVHGGVSQDSEAAQRLLHAQRALVSLNNVVHLAPNAVGAALAEHGVVDALLRLNKKVGTMAHELSPTVMLALHAILINYESLKGNCDLLATKQDLLDLVVGAVIWLGNSPERLRRSPTGIAMANRAVQICWSLSRHPTSASSQVLSLFRSVDLAGRAVHLAGSIGAPLPPMSAAAAVEDGDGPGKGAGAPPFRAPGPADGSHEDDDDGGLMDESRGRSNGELLLGLSAECSTFAAATLGLGGPLDVSSAGLRGLRAWVQDKDHLRDVRATLLALADELYGEGPLLGSLREAVLREKLEKAQLEPNPAPGGSEKAGDSSPQGSAVEARTAEGALAAHMASIEGALRNLLTCLGVPLLCADPGQQAEVTALTSFALRYHYRLLQEGFADVFKMLAARNSSYRGIYLPFFCAISDLMLEGTLTIGEKFSSWGVELDRDEGTLGDGGLFVPTEGHSTAPDAATAQSFITEQVTASVGRSQRMHKVIQLSQRAAQSRQQAQQKQAVAVATPSGPDEGSGANAPPGSSVASSCSFCANTISTGKNLRACPCGLARYCDKTCQVAHFPRHKSVCTARQKKK